MGVDQSVLVLKKGNDIEKEKVLEELDKYSDIEGDDKDQSYFDFKGTNLHLITNAKKEFEGNPPKERETFESSFSQNPCIFCFSPSSGGGFGGSASNAAASPQSFNSGGFSGYQTYGPIITTQRPIITKRPILDPKPNEISPKKQIEIRTEFPETWIFDSFEMEVK